MAHYPSGAPIRSSMSEDDVRNYRLGLLSNKLSKKGKGKEPVRNPSELEEQSESTGLDGPSPSAALAPPLQESSLGPSSTAGQEAPAKSSSRALRGSNSRSASKLAPAAPAATTTTAATTAAATATSLRRPAVAGPSFFVEAPSHFKVPPIPARVNPKEARPEFQLHTDLDPPRERPRMKRDNTESRAAPLEHYVEKLSALEDWRCDFDDYIRGLEDWMGGMEEWMHGVTKKLTQGRP